MLIISFQDFRPVHPLSCSMTDTQLTLPLEHFNAPKYGTISMIGSQHAMCHPGTRTRILEEITEWLLDAEPEYLIYCIAGSAGVGKSTIANHLANTQSNCVAARFFFSRDNAGTSTADDLCSGIADYLTKRFPKNRHLIEAIEEGRTLALSSSSLTVQWDLLVRKPLEKLSADTCLLVIDGLDECTVETRSKLIQCILKTYGRPPGCPSRFPIKVLLTTRLEQDIANEVVGNELGVRNISLDPNDRNDSVEDVKRYVTDQCQKMQHPLSQEDIGNLVSRSEGLFIFAAIVCKLVEEPNGRQELLRSIMAPSLKSPLDILYLEVLRRALSKDKYSIDNVKTVLSVILAAQVPLTIAQIVNLLPKSSPPIVVDTIVQKLGGVLGSGGMDDPVYILHATFREFLLQKTRSTDVHEGNTSYTINIHAGHRILATSCLHILLELSPPTAEEVIHRVRPTIPPTLQYAAIHWPAHVSAILYEQNMWGDIHRLFAENLLAWVEIVACLDYTVHSVHAMMQLHDAVLLNIRFFEPNSSVSTLPTALFTPKFTCIT